MPESTTPDQPVIEVVRASGEFGSLVEVVLRDLAHVSHLQTIPAGNAMPHKNLKVSW